MLSLRENSELSFDLSKHGFRSDLLAISGREDCTEMSSGPSRASRDQPSEIQFGSAL
jgi:hypothetical protein